MKKDIVGIWILSVGLLLLFALGCQIRTPEARCGRDPAAEERFDPSGVWARQDGSGWSSFYFRLRENGDPDRNTRYTVYHRKTDVDPAAEEQFRQEDIVRTQVAFGAGSAQNKSTLWMKGRTARRMNIRLQPLDGDHLLLLGEPELEGIYTRQGTGTLQCWSDWYLVQLERWVKQQGMV